MNALNEVLNSPAISHSNSQLASPTSSSSSSNIINTKPIQINQTNIDHLKRNRSISMIESLSSSFGDCGVSGGGGGSSNSSPSISNNYHSPTKTTTNILSASFNNDDDTTTGNNHKTELSFFWNWKWNKNDASSIKFIKNFHFWLCTNFISFFSMIKSCQNNLIDKCWFFPFKSYQIAFD